MPNTNLFLQLIRRNRVFVLTCTILLGLFEFLIAGVVSTIDIEGILGDLMSSLPPIMQSMVGEQMLGGMTRQGVLAFGWNHPIVLAAGGALAIVLAARAIAAEVESGAIELLLAQPISRASYLSTQVLFGLSALVLLTLGGVAGSLIGQKVYGLDPFPLRSTLALGLNFWLLHAATFAVALLISAFSREAGRVGSVGFVLLLISYIAQVLGQLWTKAAFLLPYPIYERYNPRDLLKTGTIPLSSIAVLGGILVLGIAAASVRFRRRDLP